METWEAVIIVAESMFALESWEYHYDESDGTKSAFFRFETEPDAAGFRTLMEDYPQWVVVQITVLVAVMKRRPNG